MRHIAQLYWKPFPNNSQASYKPNRLRIKLYQLLNHLVYVPYTDGKTNTAMASRKRIGWTVPGFELPLQWPEMQSVRWQPLFQPDENTPLYLVLEAAENPWVFSRIAIDVSAARIQLGMFCYTVREKNHNSHDEQSDWFATLEPQDL